MSWTVTWYKYDSNSGWGEEIITESIDSDNFDSKKPSGYDAYVGFKAVKTLIPKSKVVITLQLSGGGNNRVYVSGKEILPYNTNYYDTTPKVIEISRPTILKPVTIEVQGVVNSVGSVLKVSLSGGYFNVPKLPIKLPFAKSINSLAYMPYNLIGVKATKLSNASGEVLQEASEIFGASR